MAASCLRSEVKDPGFGVSDTVGSGVQGTTRWDLGFRADWFH